MPFCARVCVVFFFLGGGIALFCSPQRSKVLDDVSEREAALVGGKKKQLIRYRWDEAGFYAVLKARVKRHFLEKHGQRGMDPEKVSVNRFVKVRRGYR